MELSKPDCRTSKRLVGKGEYLTVRSQLLIMRAGENLLMILTVYTILGLPAALIYGVLSGTWIVPALVISLASLLFGIIYYCAKGYDSIASKLSELENVTLLTRANTADLPAPESLVRASAEPMHEQQTVLLRTATANR